MKIKDLNKYLLFKDEKILELKKLKNQGLCNISYKIKTAKKNYLLRVFNYTHQSKTSRKKEFRLQNIIFKKDIAAKAYVLDEDKGLMICDFIKGSHKKELSNKDIKHLIQSIKKLHKIKINENVFNLKKYFKNYQEPKKLIKSSLKELKRVNKYKSYKVLCHHDLNQQNILFYKGKVKFIDWEFACVNDSFFDLANICFEFNLDKKQEKQVLKRYLKKVKKRDYKKLASYKIIYENLWILWFKNQQNLEK